LTYFGASLAKKLKVETTPAQLPKPTWKAVPTLRLKCPPRLAPNQEITTEPAEKRPIITKNDAPYLAFILSWTVKKMTIPVMDVSSIGRTKMNLFL